MPDAATLKAQADRARALKSTERTFDFCGRILKAWKAKDAAGTEQMYLEAVASSTIIDRMGDSMTLACLEGMKQQAVGLTVFMNHDYDVSTDVFGTIEEARIVPASDSKQGDCYDLITRTVVEADNPRAVQTWKFIKNGRKLGQSIGGQISEYQFLDAEELWWGGLEIQAMDLWEVSVVGIPANQRAIVDGVAKGLRKKHGAPVSPEVRDAQRKAIARGVTFKDVETETQGAAAAADAEAGTDAATEVTQVTQPAAAATDAGAEETATTEAETEGGHPPQAPVPGYASVTLAADLPFDKVHAVLTAAFGDKITVKEGRTISAATKKALEAVRDCIKEAHEHNTPQGSKLDSAVSQLDDLLTPGDDAQPGADVDPNDPDAVYDAAKVETLKSEIAELETLRSTLGAQCQQLVRANTALVDDYERLAAMVRALNGTSMGRATRSSYGGAGGSTADSRYRSRSMHEVLSDMSDVTRGATDARARSLTA